MVSGRLEYREEDGFGAATEDERRAVATFPVKPCGLPGRHL